MVESFTDSVPMLTNTTEGGQEDTKRRPHIPGVGRCPSKCSLDRLVISGDIKIHKRKDRPSKKRSSPSGLLRGKFDIDKDVYLNELMLVDISIDGGGGGLNEGHDGAEQGYEDGEWALVHQNSVGRITAYSRGSM
ncbi:hypothetical protein VNO80_25793 [Phaseolus coccineus]|uniref:Uncharacterized protein n=1 Tax=Phaseolus coccineus TaxID=3886 RepID=A0AAN9LVA2_PHACN